MIAAMNIKCLSLAVLLVLAPGVRADETRVRLRELGLQIGRYPPGRYNAITDVAGVKVGHVTIVRGEGKLVPGQGPVRTGVTAIIPRDDIWHRKCFAGSFVLNGNGELSALSWVRESGWLETPILLTDTLSVGRVADAVVTWMERKVPAMGISDDVVLPMVGECDDGFLNDQRGRHVSEKDVLDALDHAAAGPVAEGAVGAGTGMVSYGFKGGIGTASRVLPREEGGFTVGVLVNANMGEARELRLGGLPIGRCLGNSGAAQRPRTQQGSIIIVVATDAPLLPHQLDRLSRRAALGLARTGTTAHHGSGDFVVSFSTAAMVPHNPQEISRSVRVVNEAHLDPLFTAVIEATEEAIGNALCRATSTVGRDGNTAPALPLSPVRALRADPAGHACPSPPPRE